MISLTWGTSHLSANRCYYHDFSRCEHVTNVSCPQQWGTHGLRCSYTVVSAWQYWSLQKEQPAEGLIPPCFPSTVCPSCVSVRWMIWHADKKVAGEVELRVDATRTRRGTCSVSEVIQQAALGLMKSTAGQMEKQSHGIITWALFCRVVRAEASLSPVVLAVLFWAAPCFPYSLCSCSPVCCGRRSSTVRSVQMAFLHAALAIILVCVFKCSEKLPLGVSMFKK